MSYEDARADLFWVKVNKNGPFIRPELGPCWSWVAYIRPDGYGAFLVGKRAEQVNRISYYFAFGVIPDGFEIDHLCRNRACVRPEHLEAVPKVVNMRRGESFSAINGRKTHCLRGHEFNDQNTYIFYQKGQRGRQCKLCKRFLLDQRRAS